MIDPLLSDRDVERITGRARSTLQKDRIAREGIPFVRLGRLVRYRESDVAAFLQSLPNSFPSAPTVTRACSAIEPTRSSTPAEADAA
jgi:predicted DNA-binding transcriptional regulator AlpA